MRWTEAFRPIRMSRVAIVASRARLRETLVALAGSGIVDIDRRGEAETTAVRTAGAQGVLATPTLLASSADVEDLERAERWDLLAGELELRRVAAQAVEHRGVAILIGWAPESAVPPLSELLASTGASVVELVHPARAEPPTMMIGPRFARPLRPLVDTYGTVPYADIDPSLFAGLSYAAMFGIMFGDVGHGLILAVLGLALRNSSRSWLQPLRRAWGLIVVAGLASAAGGALYGDVFGPTNILPALWLKPSEQPVPLLTAGLIVGAVLLGLSYCIGMANRWREGGPLMLILASSGIAGASLYAGGAALVAGAALAVVPLQIAGIVVAGVGLALLFGGFLLTSGGGVAGFTQAAVELLDTVIRTIVNAVSFVRLAAFGLAHAIVGTIVLAATAALAASGGAGLVLAAIVFVVGNVLAFGLEGLVAGLQALRLEYYELFSRVFAGVGRPFAPWRLPISSAEGP
jgi:V/A-type H+/Na+-transporting ATPase subunit I